MAGEVGGNRHEAMPGQSYRGDATFEADNQISLLRTLGAGVCRDDADRQEGAEEQAKPGF